MPKCGILNVAFMVKKFGVLVVLFVKYKEFNEKNKFKYFLNFCSQLFKEFPIEKFFLK